MSETLKKYLISVGIGLMLCFLLLSAKGLWATTELKDIMHTLCDVFFAVGTVYFCVGVLGFCSYGGAFDGLKWSIHSIFVVRNWSPKRTFKERQSFADYLEEKREERKEKGKPSFFMLFVGLGFILVSLIFLVVYINA